jgi:hypothetical protein
MLLSHQCTVILLKKLQSLIHMSVLKDFNDSELHWGSHMCGKKKMTYDIVRKGYSSSLYKGKVHVLN